MPIAACTVFKQEFLLQMNMNRVVSGQGKKWDTNNIFVFGDIHLRGQVVDCADSIGYKVLHENLCMIDFGTKVKGQTFDNLLLHGLK